LNNTGTFKNPPGIESRSGFLRSANIWNRSLSGALRDCAEINSNERHYREDVGDSSWRGSNSIQLKMEGKKSQLQRRCSVVLWSSTVRNAIVGCTRKEWTDRTRNGRYHPHHIIISRTYKAAAEGWQPVYSLGARGYRGGRCRSNHHKLGPRDPIGELGGLNLYGYTAGSSVTLGDPVELCWN